MKRVGLINAYMPHLGTSFLSSFSSIQEFSHMDDQWCGDKSEKFLGFNKK